MLPLLAVLALAAPVRAQTVHVEVHVEVETPPPVEVVIVEAPPPAPPPPVEVVVVEVPPEPSPPQVSVSAPSPIALMAWARGRIELADEHGIAALGGSAAIGATLHREWSGALAFGVLSDPDGGTELDVSIELAKDLDPSSPLAAYLLAALGATFAVEDALGRDPRVMAQLGLGARASLSDAIALLVDARAVLRYALPDLDGRDDVSIGAMLTVGLAMRL